MRLHNEGRKCCCNTIKEGKNISLMNNNQNRTFQGFENWRLFNIRTSVTFPKEAVFNSSCFNVSTALYEPQVANTFNRLINASMCGINSSSVSSQASLVLGKLKKTSTVHFP